MMPIGTLMIEHRRIEKIAPLLRRRAKLIEEGPTPHAAFIERAVDFFAEAEQTQMLETFAEFDRRLIHDKYKALLEEMESVSP